MNHVRATFFIITAVLLAALPEAGAKNVPRPVKARLVADVTAVRPSSSFKLGVLFNVDPRWHIYWKNAGDSGLPTSVELILPEGFRAGGTVWPVPIVFEGEGGIVDYGYEDSLLLYSYVTAPEGLTPGTDVPLKADVSWVSCREICIPGKASIEIKLPVSDNPEPANTALFTEWEERHPIGEFDERNPFEIEVNTEAKDAGSTEVSITLDARRELTEIGLYPATGDSLVVENINVKPQPGGNQTIVSFLVRKLKGSLATQINLDTLIVFTEKDGRRSGIELPVTLDNAQPEGN